MVNAGGGPPAPGTQGSAQPAKSAWTAFYDEWAEEQAAAEGELAAAYSKLEAYAARFALMHHVVSEVAAGEDDRAPIGVDSVQAGIALCRWFANEARRIYAILSESTEDRDTRRLVEFIRARGGRITVRQLQASNTRKYASAAQAKAALDALAKAGLALWYEGDVPAHGGHKPKHLELIPTHNTSYTRPAGGRGDA